jgi:hypothetical protein
VRLAGLLIRPALLAAVVLVVLLSLPNLQTSRALAIWVVLVAALVLMVLIRQSTEPGWSEPRRRFEEALRRRKPAPAQAVEFLRMERELSLGMADADHAHRRLLPLLRAAAAARLAARHGTALERRPETARALLGDEVWELLRPDRPDPEDRHGPGVQREQVVAVIEAVEAL